MIYEYECDTCMNIFEMVRPVEEYNHSGNCPICNNYARRLISKNVSMKIGKTLSDKVKRDAFSEGWNPGLGCYVKSRGHQKEILKRRGLEEIGNEKIETKCTNKDEYYSDKIFKNMHNAGLKLSDNEIEGLKKGRIKATLSKEDQRTLDSV